jgi:PAS domain S-box-containing protein
VIILTTKKTERHWFRPAYFMAATAIFVMTIVYLGLSIIWDLRQLESASSDNVQWTLSQTEVEFLEFAKRLSEANANETNDFAQMRQRFDIFYSRIQTLQSASVYASLHELERYEAALLQVHAFLDYAVPLIDSDGPTLRAALDDLAVSVEQTRPLVRTIANSALDYFATQSDTRRKAFAETLLHVAVLMAILVTMLALAVYYLRQLNLQNTVRERETLDTANRMNTVIQTSLDGVIVGDSEGRIIAFNAAAETIFGHRSEDVLGKNLGPLIIPDHLINAHDAGMLRMRNGGEKHVVGKGRVKLEAKRSNGDIFPVELAIQSAQTDEGDIFIAFLRDISASVEAEKELIAARDQALAADQLKTEFLATMSHEIRTPLNGLLGNLTLIQDTKMNSQQLRYIRNMETSGDLLLRHVSDVLDITRYDVGQLQLQQVPINLAKVIQGIVDNQSGMATTNSTTLVWGWDGKPANWVLSDPDRLQHILMNLIGNAVKFTRGGRVSIMIDAEDRDDGLADFTFRVTDTGQGIDDALIDRIFDDFVTGTTAYDRIVGGTGLGLSIARRFATAMGGSITLESEVGVGSTFSLHLPLSLAAPVDDPAQVTVAELPMTGFHILIVEDNEINRTVVREMLRKDGQLTTEVQDGAAAVEIANDRSFDLILMDISMPIMDGRAATRAIRSGSGVCANKPIVALTANALATEQAHFLEDGMNAILTKPLSRDALRNTIHTLLADGPEQECRKLKSPHANEMRDLVGEGKYSELRIRFIAEVDHFHGWLAEKPQAALSDVADQAHKIAGSAATFGMTDYRAALVTVENAAKDQQLDDLRAAITSLGPIWDMSQSSF